jgi:hypothetical protein
MARLSPHQPCLCCLYLHTTRKKGVTGYDTRVHRPVFQVQSFSLKQSGRFGSVGIRINFDQVCWTERPRQTDFYRYARDNLVNITERMHILDGNLSCIRPGIALVYPHRQLHRVLSSTMGLGQPTSRAQSLSAFV